MFADRIPVGSFALLLLCACAGNENTPIESPVSASPPANATASSAAGQPVDPLAAPPDVASAPVEAERTSSGLASKVLTKGTGTARPAAGDHVTVHYTGWTKDGKMFDSSRARGAPATFLLDRVIPGWSEGVRLMLVGEKRRLWIPSNLAYGDHPKVSEAPAGDLTFDVELIAIAKGPALPAAPSDVAGPPPSASRTPSGLAYHLLQPSADSQAQSPGPNDRVTVNYTGWTTDGVAFDSSIARGKPATFPLSRVIKGWSEGLQRMKVGEKMRFWIPANLAYEDPDHAPRAGAPRGMLVFDVELLGIKPASAASP